MTEIFYWLGQQPNIKSIDITEFNPSCEDFESSLILLNLLYHFLMGWTKRNQSSNKWSLVFDGYKFKYMNMKLNINI